MSFLFGICTCFIVMPEIENITSFSWDESRDQVSKFPAIGFRSNCFWQWYMMTSWHWLTSPWPKLPLFRRQHMQMICHEWRVLYFSSNFTDNYWHSSLAHIYGNRGRLIKHSLNYWPFWGDSTMIGGFSLRGSSNEELSCLVCCQPGLGVTK